MVQPLLAFLWRGFHDFNSNRCSRGVKTITSTVESTALLHGYRLTSDVGTRASTFTEALCLVCMNAEASLPMPASDPSPAALR